MDRCCMVALFFMTVQQCVCGFHDIRHSAPRKELRPDNLKSLRHMAKIKQTILRHLGITDSPRTYQTTPSYSRRSNPDPDTDNQNALYEITDISSFHSEPSDNFTDENIIQFRLFKRSYETQVEVINVNLLVRIKSRRTKEDKRKQRDVESKRIRRLKRKRNFKDIKLLVSNVTAGGKPDTLITSVKAKLRKTKSIKLSLPREMIQNVLDSSQRIVQLFIQCEGCDKKTRLILVHKKRRKNVAKARGSRPPRLHKRRPILFVYSHIPSGS